MGHTMTNRPTIDQHNRAITDACTEAGEMPTGMIAHRVGVRTPPPGWGETTLRFGWLTGIATIVDLAPVDLEGRIEWLMRGIDDDTAVTPAVVKRVTEAPVFRDRTALDTASTDLSVGGLGAIDRDEMTELEYADHVVFVVLELAAHAAIEEVLTEYRRLMAPEEG